MRILDARAFSRLIILRETFIYFPLMFSHFVRLLFAFCSPSVRLQSARRRPVSDLWRLQWNARTHDMIIVIKFLDRAPLPFTSAFQTPRARPPAGPLPGLVKYNIVPPLAKKYTALLHSFKLSLSVQFLSPCLRARSLIPQNRGALIASHRFVPSFRFPFFLFLFFRRLLTAHVRLVFAGLRRPVRRTQAFPRYRIRFICFYVRNRLPPFCLVLKKKSIRISFLSISTLWRRSEDNSTKSKKKKKTLCRSVVSEIT